MRLLADVLEESVDHCLHNGASATHCCKWTPDSIFTAPAVLPQQWLPQNQTRLTAVPTAFSGKEVVCPEGHVCMSRVARFGAGHHGEVDKDKAVRADAVWHEKSPEDLAAAGKEYEWKCPAGGIWTSQRYEVGSEPDQCKEDLDCVCLQKGFPESSLSRRNGEEMMHLLGTSQLGVKVRPHYAIRSMPDSDSSEILDPDVGLGQTLMVPREQWISQYRENAPKLQYALDVLRKWVGETYDRDVENQPMACGTKSDPTHGLQGKQLRLASAMLRRFHLLSSECEQTRDMASRIIPEYERGFAKDGTHFGQRLHCELGPTEPMCVQLNCYNDHPDREFRDQLLEYDRKVQECTEPDPRSKYLLGPSATDTTPPSPVTRPMMKPGLKPPPEPDSSKTSSPGPRKEEDITHPERAPTGVTTSPDNSTEDSSRTASTPSTTTTDTSRTPEPDHKKKPHHTQHTPTKPSSDDDIVDLSDDVDESSILQKELRDLSESGDPERDRAYSREMNKSLLSPNNSSTDGALLHVTYVWQLLSRAGHDRECPAPPTILRDLHARDFL